MEGRRWRKSHQALEWNQIRLSAREALSRSSALRPLPPSISHSAAPFVPGRLSPQLETPRPQPKEKGGASVYVRMCRTDVEFELYSILLTEQTQGCFLFSREAAEMSIDVTKWPQVSGHTPSQVLAPLCSLFVCLFWTLVRERAKSLARILEPIWHRRPIKTYLIMCINCEKNLLKWFHTKIENLFSQKFNKILKEINWILSYTFFLHLSTFTNIECHVT